MKRAIAVASLVFAATVGADSKWGNGTEKSVRAQLNAIDVPAQVLLASVSGGTTVQGLRVYSLPQMLQWCSAFYHPESTDKGTWLTSVVSFDSATTAYFYKINVNGSLTIVEQHVSGDVAVLKPVATGKVLMAPDEAIQGAMSCAIRHLKSVEMRKEPAKLPPVKLR